MYMNVTLYYHNAIMVSYMVKVSNMIHLYIVSIIIILNYIAHNCNVTSLFEGSLCKNNKWTKKPSIQVDHGPDTVKVP